MKAQLLETASALEAPPAPAVEEFNKKHEQLAAMGNLIMNQRPDLEKLVGEGNWSMAEDNNRNFARFMASLFIEYNPEIFLNTVLWVFRAYRSHGFQTLYWAANLNIWMHILKKELTPESFTALFPFYNWLIVNIPEKDGDALYISILLLNGFKGR